MAVTMVREMVLDGRLEPGQRVNEVELAENLGISRGPLREAIQRLASEGLFTVRSHRGATVKDFGLDELRELYEVRLALESFAIRSESAARKREALDSLSKLLDETRQVLAAGGAQPYPRELDFHRQIVALSGNSALVEMHGLTLQKIELARSRSAKDPQRAREALLEHEAILRALHDGNQEVAAETLIAHLSHSLHSAGSIFSANRK
jgi:DNA-binding GntR family transcriptional regulator